MGQGALTTTAMGAEYTLVLDHGVFDWLWHIVEAKRKQAAHYEGTALQHHLDMIDRAVHEFRSAHAGVERRVQEIRTPSAPPRKISKKR